MVLPFQNHLSLALSLFHFTPSLTSLCFCLFFCVCAEVPIYFWHLIQPTQITCSFFIRSRINYTHIRCVFRHVRSLLIYDPHRVLIQTTAFILIVYAPLTYTNREWEERDVNALLSLIYADAGIKFNSIANVLRVCVWEREQVIQSVNVHMKIV